jgi:hypothetical protein
MESDDSEIQDVYRGCYTGTGYPYNQFVNVFMGYLQVALFKIVPGIPWWFVTEIAYAVVGAMCFNYTMLFLSWQQKRNGIWNCFFPAFLYCPI